MRHRSRGVGVAEPARPGILNAVEERHITVPTRERKVDFFGGVPVAMAEGMEQIIRGWCWGGMGSERVEQ